MHICHEQFIVCKCKWRNENLLYKSNDCVCGALPVYALSLGHCDARVRLVRWHCVVFGRFCRQTALVLRSVFNSYIYYVTISIRIIEFQHKRCTYSYVARERVRHEEKQYVDISIDYFAVRFILFVIHSFHWLSMMFSSTFFPSVRATRSQRWNGTFTSMLIWHSMSIPITFSWSTRYAVLVICIQKQYQVHWWMVSVRSRSLAHSPQIDRWR